MLEGVPENLNLLHVPKQVDAIVVTGAGCHVKGPVVSGGLPHSGSGDSRSSRLSVDSRFLNERINCDISLRYDIDRSEIGSGGCGRVYLAKDRKFQNRLVAIKKVLQPPGTSEALLSKEVDIMKHLDHPAICKLFETYRRGRLMFFVMEFCAGGDLYDRFSAEGGTNESTAAAIIWQVASALAYAHWRGIAHRDLKLENICFIRGDETCNDVKVIDWGFGKMFSDERMISTVGTSTYAAPEVLTSQQNTGQTKYPGYTSACDLWSLGVLTYVSLCGKPPFWGGVKDQLRRMRTESYPLTGPIWDNISAECKHFVRSLLRVDPAQRYTAAEALQHPWLAARRSAKNVTSMRRVLLNVEHFSRASRFVALCMLCVARQIDHVSLTHVRNVFNALDTAGKGVLTKDVFLEGFKQCFSDCEMRDHDVDEIFRRLDLSGQNVITYTEFCAAGMDARIYAEDHVLWAAFKTFDQEDQGRISLDGMRQLLSNADINDLLTKDVAKEVMDEFGGSDNSINFEDWLKLMRTYSRVDQWQSSSSFRLRHVNAEMETSCSSQKPRGTSCSSGLKGFLLFLAGMISD